MKLTDLSVRALAVSAGQRTFFDDTFPGWFCTIQEFANGTKHFGAPSFRTEFVVSPPYTYGEPADEWDEGYPKPYVADGGKGHLLLDYGPGTGPHRWQTAAALIDAVVCFWRQFFYLYHPNLNVRAEVRDYRLIA
jgi:hypothetical protein